MHCFLLLPPPPPPAPSHSAQRMLGQMPAIPLLLIPTVIDPPPYLVLAVPQPLPQPQTSTSDPLVKPAICTKSRSLLLPQTHPLTSTPTTSLEITTYAPPFTLVPPITSRLEYTRSRMCTGIRNPSMKLGSLLPMRRLQGSSLSKDRRRGETFYVSCSVFL